jgi:hypothetical protein
VPAWIVEKLFPPGGSRSTMKMRSSLVDIGYRFGTSDGSVPMMGTYEDMRTCTSEVKKIIVAN